MQIWKIFVVLAWEEKSIPYYVKVENQWELFAVIGYIHSVWDAVKTVWYKQIDEETLIKENGELLKYPKGKYI